jgi:hypothetical protein
MTQKQIELPHLGQIEITFRQKLGADLMSYSVSLSFLLCIILATHTATLT